MGRIFLIVNLFFILSSTAGATSASSSSISESSSYSECGSSFSSSYSSASSKEQVKCKSYEEFSNCTQALCRRLKCSEQGKPVTCTEVDARSCKSGCVCPAGQLRTHKKACVPENQCYGKLVCKDNEVVNSCPKKHLNYFCPISENEESCSEDEDESEACGVPVCVCGFNEKRDRDSGKCISTRDCPPFNCSGINEEYNACPPYCPTDICSQATPTGFCPLPGRIGIVVECKPACRCIEGYWRDNGICGPYLACPGKCPSNERFSSCIQGECRALNCTQKDQPIACPRIAEGFCKQGCVCVEGTLRASNGSCVAEDKCPVQCKSYEEFSNCTQALCRRLKCSEQGKPVDCADIDEESCESGCVCPAGQLMTDEGACVPENQCYGTLVCKDNEIVNSCPKKRLNDFCPISENMESCSEDEDESEACGVPVCVCGFNEKRDHDSGKCIPTRDCPPFNCSGINEEYNACPPYCPTDNCSQATPTGRCPLPGRIGIVVECKPACRCIEGYWRDNGVCGPYLACPGKCPYNEKFSSCIQGECRALNCTQKDQPIACSDIVEGSCEQGCVCVEGTLKASNGSCVAENKCPVTCSANEEFSNCTQAVCRELNCSQRGQPLDCQGGASTADEDCQSGCLCKPGYLRTACGSCVPQNQCYGDVVCNDNEVVITCPNYSFGDHCCPRSEEEAQQSDKMVDEPCSNMTCICKFNYSRDENGICIPTKDCPPFECSGINQEFNPCPPVCPSDDCSQATPTGRCPFGRIGIVLPCRPNCRCITGYWKNSSEVCVPYAECPGKCPMNEEFSTCAQAVCRAQTCDQKGQPMDCPEIAKESCEERCVCVEGTFRNASDVCVPENECPDPTCGKNEYLNECANGCDPVGCPNSYAEEQARLADCFASAVCLPSSCRCLPGYRRDRNQNCIYIGLCPGICPKNEEFSNCTQSISRPQDCAGSRYTSPADENSPCTAGCVCKEHMLRDQNGDCVPSNQCPDLECGQNEVPSCVHECPPEKTCKTRNIQFRCKEPTKECEQKCVCKPDHYRNPIGECVTRKQCEKCNGTNEFFSCGQECDNECSMLATQNRTNCPYINVMCNPMCYCEDGFARDPKKQCVPVEDCPKLCN